MKKQPLDAIIDILESSIKAKQKAIKQLEFLLDSRFYEEDKNNESDNIDDNFQDLCNGDEYNRMNMQAVIVEIIGQYKNSIYTDNIIIQRTLNVNLFYDMGIDVSDAIIFDDKIIKDNIIH